MNYTAFHPTRQLKGEITLTASKSESNRALIIQALCETPFEINNLAAAEDTRVLNEILQTVKSNNTTEPHTYNVGAAGTTMRFLTAYLSTQQGTHVLTGSERMKNRPIKILVEALRDLGAEINYLEKEGYPPLEIKGKALAGGVIEIDGSVSSQYITALLLIAPSLQKGITLRFKGKVTSVPYIQMTLKMLQWFGVQPRWEQESEIVVASAAYIPSTANYFIEGDWSSASYWYAFASLANELDLTVHGLNEVSLQGDADIVQIAGRLGVHTQFEVKNKSIRLSKQNKDLNYFSYNFSDCPDLAQTIAVVVAALKIPSTFTGLHTLRIKETDRTAALKNELAKLGTRVNIINDDEMRIIPGELIPNPSPIATYEDHRMAMAFAAIAMLEPITIEDPEVVKKSYPDFWKDLQSAGFSVEKA